MKKILLNDVLEKNKALKELYKQCDNYFDMPTPKTHPSKSTTYMGMAICNLSLAFVVSKDNRYLNEAIRFMDTVTGYEVWGANHLVNVDLSASFILFGLSLGYNWLNEYLSEDQKARYLNKILIQANIMYQYKLKTKGSGWSTNYWQNHNWINHTSMLMASLVVDSPEAKLWQKEAMDNFDYIYKHIPTDGSNYEGIAYWRYGGIWLFISAYILKKELGVDYFNQVDYFKNTFYFRLYQTDALLYKQLNFGDAHDRYSSHPVFLYYMIGELYNDPYARWYGDYIFDNYLYQEQYNSKIKPGILPEMWLTYLFYNENKERRNVKNLPKYRYFPDLGLIAIRSGYEKNAATFAIKCGYPGGRLQFISGHEHLNYLALGHHHPDNLSYILTKGEDYFVIDDGYNRSVDVMHHNNLLVDNQLLDVMKVSDCYKESLKKKVSNGESLESYGGFIKDFKELDSHYLFTMDNTNMYPLNLNMNKVSRTVYTDNVDIILFIDTFSSKEEHIYKIQTNSDYAGQIIDNGDLYNGHFNQMYHLVMSKHPLKRACGDYLVRSIMTTQEPDNYCQTTLRQISYEIKAKDISALEFMSFEKPYVTRNDEVIIIETANSKISVYIDKYPSNIKTDAAALVVTEKGQNIYYSVIGGKVLEINNKQILDEEKVSNYIVK